MSFVCLAHQKSGDVYSNRWSQFRENKLEEIAAGVWPAAEEEGLPPPQPASVELHELIPKTLLDVSRDLLSPPPPPTETHETKHHLTDQFLYSFAFAFWVHSHRFAVLARGSGTFMTP